MNAVLRYLQVALTRDIVHWAAALGCIDFLVLAAYDVAVQHHDFHPQDFGIGLGALLTGVGAALGLKKGADAPPPPPPAP